MCSAQTVEAELVEAVAHQEDPHGSENGGDNDRDAEPWYKEWTHYRSDPEDSREDAGIGRKPGKRSLKHDQANDENAHRRDEDRVHSEQGRCQHRNRVARSRDDGRPLSFVRQQGISR